MVACVGKKLVKQQCVPHMSLQYGEIRLRVRGTPANLSYCSDVAHRRPTKLYTLFGCLLGCYAIYTISRALARQNFARCNIHFTLSLAFFYIGSVTARHSSSGREPNFAAWYKEWNYRTFAEGATYIRQGGHHVWHGPTF